MEVWKFSNSTSLRFDKTICGVVCTACSMAFRTDTRTLDRHLRSAHKMDTALILDIQKSVKEKEATMVSLHRHQQKYWEPDGTILQRIQGIRTVSAFRCTCCHVVSSSASSLQKHIRKMHKKAIGLPHIREKNIVKAQKLRSFPSRHTTYEVWRTAEEMRRSRKSQMDKRQTRSSEGKGEYVTDFCGDDVEYVASDLDGSPQYINAYTRLAEVVERSEVLGVSLNQAAALRRGCVEATDKFAGLHVTSLRNAIRLYATTSISSAKSGTLYPGELRKITSPGAQATLRDLCLNLSPPTLQKYSSYVLYMLLALFRLCTGSTILPSFPLPSSLRKKANALLAGFVPGAVRDGRIDQDNLHAVLVEVLIGQDDDRSQPCDQFMYGYILCLSAKSHSDGGLQAAPGFRKGIDVSPAVAGLLYFGSMAAITAVSKSSAQDRSSTLNRLAVQFRPGCCGIIGLLSKIRSICSSLRTQESTCISTRSCYMPGHMGCIAVGNNHLSILMVGKAIKAMHKSAARLERLLMFTFEVPNRLLRGMDTLSENPSVTWSGYSFVSDENNLDFVRECRSMISSLLGPRLKESPQRRKEWLKRGCELAKVIISLLYLCGGAPGRCTELASLNYKNSDTAKRNIIVNGQEVIINPEYAKQSILKQGLQEPILRFMDVDSGRCYKRFVILYLPVITRLLEQDRRSSTIYVNPSWISSPEAVINEGLRLHGVPVTTRLYRQWYGWYAKTRSAATKAALLYSNDYNRKDATRRGSSANVMSRQSGHSDRTSFMCYGRGEGIAGVDRGNGIYTTTMFREASRVFHEDCGLLSPSSTSDVQCDHWHSSR